MKRLIIKDKAKKLVARMSRKELWDEYKAAKMTRDTMRVAVCREALAR